MIMIKGIKVIKNIKFIMFKLIKLEHDDVYVLDHDDLDLLDQDHCHPDHHESDIDITSLEPCPWPRM